MNSVVYCAVQEVCERRDDAPTWRTGEEIQIKDQRNRRGMHRCRPSGSTAVSGGRGNSKSEVLGENVESWATIKSRFSASAMNDSGSEVLLSAGSRD